MTSIFSYPQIHLMYRGLRLSLQRRDSVGVVWDISSDIDVLVSVLASLDKARYADEKRAIVQLSDEQLSSVFEGLDLYASLADFSSDPEIGPGHLAALIRRGSLEISEPLATPIATSHRRHVSVEIGQLRMLRLALYQATANKASSEQDHLLRASTSAAVAFLGASCVTIERNPAVQRTLCSLGSLTRVDASFRFAVRPDVFGQLQNAVDATLAGDLWTDSPDKAQVVSAAFAQIGEFDDPR